MKPFLNKFDDYALEFHFAWSCSNSWNYQGFGYICFYFPGLLEMNHGCSCAICCHFDGVVARRNARNDDLDYILCVHYAVTTGGGIMCI